MTPPVEYWSLLRLSDELRRRAISSLEATEAMLARIASVDGTLRSYVTVVADRALDQARRADAEIARGLSRGPLHGVPLAVKDLCFTTYAPTTAGMTIYKDWRPDYDATVVTRLEQAGAVILGKLQMTEGATGVHHPAVRPPRNPWHGDYWTGISSSGSGVAPAAGLCYGSLGSDTGGSIRFPSTACGLTGIKPTWGRVSRHGIFTLADSLDHIGPMARSAADCAAILGVIAGEDPMDPTVLDASVPNYLAEIGTNIRGLKIGIDPGYAYDGVDSEVVAAMREAERALASLGARIERVQFPPAAHIATLSLPLMAPELADAHRETYPARASEYGPLLGAMLKAGRAVPAIDIAEAQRARRDFRGRVDRLWRDVDMLLLPSMPQAVPKAADVEDIGKNSATMTVLCRFTTPFDLTGSPTISLPCGFSKNGLPLGLQLVGPHLSESVLCRAGHAFQQATDWHTRHPDLSWAH